MNTVRVPTNASAGALFEAGGCLRVEGVVSCDAAMAACRAFAGEHLARVLGTGARQDCRSEHECKCYQPPQPATKKRD